MKSNRQTSNVFLAIVLLLLVTLVPHHHHGGGSACFAMSFCQENEPVSEDVTSHIPHHHPLAHYCTLSMSSAKIFTGVSTGHLDTVDVLPYGWGMAKVDLSYPYFKLHAEPFFYLRHFCTSPPSGAHTRRGPPSCRFFTA